MPGVEGGGGQPEAWRPQPVGILSPLKQGLSIQKAKAASRGFPGGPAPGVMA